MTENRPAPGTAEPHTDARRSQGWTAGPEDRDPADRMETEPEEDDEERDRQPPDEADS